MFVSLFFFFFNDTATTEIYTLSLHDALPISFSAAWFSPLARVAPVLSPLRRRARHSRQRDRKSTRLNSSHEWISYAVFCLKKKKETNSSCVDDGMGSDDYHRICAAFPCVQFT